MKKPRVILLNLKGGFGNQLYQLNAAYTLQEKINASLYITVGSFHTDSFKRLPDSLELLHLFKDYKFYILKKNINFIFKFIRLICLLFNVDTLKVGNLFCATSSLKGCPDIFDSKYLLLDGYFQDVEINSSFKASLLSSLSHQVHNKDKITNYLSYLRDNQSIIIHIRGNDYLRSPFLRQHYGLLELNYYKRAVSKIGRIRELSPSDFKIYIATDDPNFAESVACSIFSEFTILQESNIDTFLILTQSANVVLSNSSYSCIAAHFSEHTDPCICYPCKWFIDSSIMSPTPDKNWHSINNSFST